MAAHSKKSVVKEFRNYPQAFKDYFGHFEKLVDDEYPWSIILTYIFSQIELAQNKTIHGVIVKLHYVDTELARNAVDKRHMTRDGFRQLYKKVVKQPICQEAIDKAKFAEGVRDKILHGKRVPDADKRKAVLAALEFSHLLNEQVAKEAGFRPFGDMRGFSGRSEKYDKSTSRWILLGMGLISEK